MEENNKKRIFEETTFWEHLTGEEKEMLLQMSHTNRFAKGEVIGSSDTSCMGMVFVIEGGLRISLLSEEGREITLYRMVKGDCCVTTASCVIRQITFDTVVTASGETSLLVVPAPLFSGLLNENIYFRAFVYEIETKRFSQAIWAIQELLFKRFDQRLASYLLAAFEANGSAELKLTQEELARDINSAREVVARMLHHFSEEGLVEVKRGRILLRDPEGLKKI